MVCARSALTPSTSRSSRATTEGCLPSRSPVTRESRALPTASGPREANSRSMFPEDVSLAARAGRERPRPPARRSPPPRLPALPAPVLPPRRTSLARRGERPAARAGRACPRSELPSEATSGEWVVRPPALPLPEFVEPLGRSAGATKSVDSSRGCAALSLAYQVSSASSRPARCRLRTNALLAVFSASHARTACRCTSKPARSTPSLLRSSRAKIGRR